MQIKLNPTNGDCWNTFAHVLFKKGDIEGSRKAVGMALESVPLPLARSARTRSVSATSPFYFAPKAVPLP